jgi:Protein of unknown function (DUF3037)
VPALSTYDYAIIRVVPKVERDEFINVGVILWCEDHDFAAGWIEMDEARVLSVDPTADLEALRAHLASIPTICTGGKAGGPLSHLTKRERFLMLAAPRSTMIQPSPLHTGLCEDPAATLEHLMDSMVRPVKPSRGN